MVCWRSFETRTGETLWSVSEPCILWVSIFRVTFPMAKVFFKCAYYQNCKKEGYIITILTISCFMLVWLGFDSINHPRKLTEVFALRQKSTWISLTSCPELSRQSCEIRDLRKYKARLALDKVNGFKGLKSCKILMLRCLFKGYNLSMLISFMKEIWYSLMLMAFLLYLKCKSRLALNKVKSH